MAMKREITVTVNGQQHHSQVEPRMLLVHYLRDVLDLTGTHIGCDTSQCGACTILLDGDFVKACTVLAVQADGSEVTTIEGLAPKGSSASDPGKGTFGRSTACSVASAHLG